MNKITTVITTTILTLSSLGSTLFGQPGNTVTALHTLEFNPMIDRASADNILLNLRFIQGDEETLNQRGQTQFWEAVRKPNAFSINLQPGEVFAFHTEILPRFKNDGVKTPAVETHFSAADGYKFSGALYGNGVCFLASLINWVVADAGLEVTAETNHDFYPVPGVPREYGTSIFYAEGETYSQKQNLYVKNSLEVPVELVFESEADWVAVSVVIN